MDSIRKQGWQDFTLSLAPVDGQSGLAAVGFPALFGQDAALLSAAPYQVSYGLDPGQDMSGYYTLSAADRVGNEALSPQFRLVKDSAAPTAEVFAPAQPALAFRVNWQGQDAQAGVDYYDLQYREKEAQDWGNWLDWQTGTQETSARFVGQAGYEYQFRVRAADRVGNLGEWVTGSPAAVQNVTIYYYAGSVRVAMRQGERVTYLLADHLGSTQVTADEQGSELGRYLYTAWGETRQVSGETATDRLYTGQRQEAEIGLYFYNARWYDPALGRFAQADTIVPNPASSKAWDRYAYAFNNPILFFDPSGHASTSACIDGVYCGTPVTKPMDTINYWKGIIESNYGVIMSDDEGSWDVKNLVRIYIGLTYMDKNFLQGQTNRLVSGAMFLFTRSENGYGGQTFKGNDNPLLGGQIAFYTHSAIPYQNLYHEFAHLLDNRLGDRITEKLGASAVYYEGEYLFGGKGIGNIDLSTIMKFKLPDSYVSTGVDAFQHPSSDPIEQWADMWANYVSGNLKMNEAGGILVKSWITTNINPILEVRGAR